MDDLLVHYKLHNNYGLNHQLGELGLRHINGERQAEHMIKVIEEVYDFVAIYELLPESLVLLAHHLCIPLANVTYLIPDERQHKVDDAVDAFEIQRFIAIHRRIASIGRKLAN